MKCQENTDEVLYFIPKTRTTMPLSRKYNNIGSAKMIGFARKEVFRFMYKMFNNILPPSSDIRECI